MYGVFSSSSYFQVRLLFVCVWIQVCLDSLSRVNFMLRSVLFLSRYHVHVLSIFNILLFGVNFPYWWKSFWIRKNIPNFMLYVYKKMLRDQSFLLADTVNLYIKHSQACTCVYCVYTWVYTYLCLINSVYCMKYYFLSNCSYSQCMLCM